MSLCCEFSGPERREGRGGVLPVFPYGGGDGRRDQGVGDFRPERNRKWLFIFLISSLRLH